MAKKMTRKQREEFRDLLDDFDVGPGYGNLLRQWVIFDWTEQEFAQRLVDTPRFKRQFPGLFTDGELNPFLTGKEDASINLGNIGGAVERYKTLWTAYETGGRNHGYGKLNRRQVATLIRNNVSPDEFATKTYAVRQFTKSKESLDIFNQQLKAMGIKPLRDKQDQFRFLARMGDQKLYDAYEAAQLQSLGLGLTAQENISVARSLNEPGPGGSQLIDTQKLASLVAEVKAREGDIGPELEAAGISSLDLSRFVASGGTTDPTLALKLEQLVASKRSRSSFVQGPQVRQGPGGATQYADQGTAAYG